MKRRGFTLVELMIVVSILGILAAIVLPKFQTQASESKDTAVKSTLYTVRTQIELYKMQHNGLYPGYVGAAPSPLTNYYYQFIGTSQVNGLARASKITDSTYLYGPYMMQMPKNPFNDLADVTIVADGTTTFTPNDSTGWLYEKTTGTFKINKTGTDSDGTAYVDY